MFENPRRGRQARNFTTNVPKILDLKSSSEQIFSENCRWVPLKLITHLTFDSEYQALLFLSFLECVFLQCFLVLIIQNGESEIYFLININLRYFSLFKAGVTRVSMNFVWVPGGVSRSFIASIHPHTSIFFNTPVRTHVLLNSDFFFFRKNNFLSLNQDD